MELVCCLQLLWLRVLMSKWFNVKIVDDFSSDELSADDGDAEEEEEEEEEEEDVYSRCDSETVSPFPNELRNIQLTDTTWSIQQEMLEREFVHTEHLRIAVGTWNVAGRSPPPDLDLKEWLEWNHPADIYVVGFQEIVPLNVRNVCGIDDIKPAIKWQDLIRDTLNKLEVEAEGNSIHGETLPLFAYETQSDETTEDETLLVRPLLSSLPSVPFTCFDPGEKQERYIRVASKQMVGIHISVWVRRKLCRYIHNLSVSCVGLGLMGCLGNKGSVSVSMRLYQTSLCFICAHLTSGGKKRDEERRNWDAKEILKRTHFPRNKDATMDNLRNIWGHDRIVWLGDLNYRLDLMDIEIRSLVAQANWKTLLKKDQLKKQSKKGHIFEGWREGTITFAPTYKYEFESNDYAGENVKPGEKQRSPAWCDRVLWHGKGMKQLAYKRGESTFSDHRPVLAVLLVEVEVLNTKPQKLMVDQAYKPEG